MIFQTRLAVVSLLLMAMSAGLLILAICGLVETHLEGEASLKRSWIHPHPLQVMALTWELEAWPSMTMESSGSRVIQHILVQF